MRHSEVSAEEGMCTVPQSQVESSDALSSVGGARTDWLVQQ